MWQGSRPVVLPNTCRPLSFSRFQVSSAHQEETEPHATSPCKSILSSQAPSVEAQSLHRLPFHQAHRLSHLLQHSAEVEFSIVSGYTSINTFVCIPQFRNVDRDNAHHDQEVWRISSTTKLIKTSNYDVGFICIGY